MMQGYRVDTYCMHGLDYNRCQGARECASWVVMLMLAGAQVGLNNMRANDYANVVVHILARVAPIRCEMVWTGGAGWATNGELRLMVKEKQIIY